MNIFHCLGRKRRGGVNRFPVFLDDLPLFVALGDLLAAGQQLVKVLLHDVRIKLLQLHSGQIRLDMQAYIVLVDFDCAGLDALQIGICPDVQPFPQRHFARLTICLIVHGGDRLCQLLAGFLLRLCVDGFADRLTGAGIMTGDKAGFPFPSGRWRMLPAPCAARVFDFLGIDFPSYIVLIWKGSRLRKFTALIAALGVRSTGGGFYH